MAYDHRGGFGNPSPITDSEHRPSPWVQRDHGHHRHSSSFQSIPVHNIMDPESEDSDVSNTEGDYNSGFAFPINLPPAPSKSALENLDTVTAHLKELERVEAHNVRKHERLKEKRVRKDERIARKRAAQDEKIKTIMDARARHDSRINQRRERENIAFQRFYEDLDEEETRLQTRLKRLKRGHLVDEAGPGRRISLTATSPTVPSYSTVPPPAKRHRTSHPTQAEAPPSYPPPPTAHQPSYHFHPGPGPSQSQGQNQHNSGPYRQGPPYHSPSYGRSPPIPSHSRVPSTVHESHANTPNGQKASPRLPPPVGTSHQAPLSAPSPAPAPVSASQPISHAPSSSHPPPPRQSGATYDTRPPPPHTSGFAAINHPPNASFAAVNSVHHAPPTTPHAPPLKEEHHKQSSSTTDQTPIRSTSADDKQSTGGPGGNKRTPSTTHPYQMSEAFANRHHHCERTDSLNRGIWTWYGLQGTKESPTSSPTEMYLVCNHDGCRRIDWRTVHGLQCHIVKSHEQPKGTIGSLEKALAAYGVPVKNIEEHERQHGPGSGGTMADPKNNKVRTKVKDLADRRDLSERDSPAPPSGPIHMHKHHSRDSDSPRVVHPPLNAASRKRSHSFDEQVPDSGSEHTPVETHKLPTARAVSGFPAVNTTWQGINATPTKPPHAREWQGNQPVRPEKRSPTAASQAPPTGAHPAPFWPSWQARTDAPVTHLPTPTPPTPPKVMNMASPRELGFPKPNATSQALPQTQETDQPKSHSVANVKEGQDGMAKSDVRESIGTNQSPLTNANRDTSMGEPKAEEQDVQMTNTAEKPQETATREITAHPPPPPPPVVSVPEPKTPNQTAKEDRGPPQADEMEHDQRTPARELQVLPPKNEGEEVKSPEMSNRRISSRRSSRRPSTATTPSARNVLERPKDDDIDTNYTANTASKAESVDDDSDSITVNLVASGGPKDKDSDRTKPTGRLSNGRFSRLRRQR